MDARASTGRNVQKVHKTKTTKKLRNFDYSMLLLILILVSFGLVMLYSVSAYSGSLYYDNPAFYLRKQVIAALIGLVMAAVCVRLDYHIFAVFTWPLYLLSLISCIAVLFVGQSLNNSSRWLSIFGVSVQPSEFAKFAVILFLATYIAKTPRELRDAKKVMKAFCMVLPFVLVIAYNNLSTAIIVAGIAFVMLFVASPQRGLFAFLILLGGAAVAAFIAFEGYRGDRIAVWLHPEQYERGYQTLQGLYAIGSGGLFGKGLGGSMQKMGFVPEAQNDMIFSIICEELGLVGAVGLLLLYLLLLWRFLVDAMEVRDMFGSFLLIGIMTHIALQVILNIAVVTNTIPNTGITLPFISYGGTSMMLLIVEMGVALSVTRGIPIRTEEENR